MTSCRRDTRRTWCGMRCARALDLSAIFAAYGEARGQPPYHPVMMVALLLYAYSVGVYSSRPHRQGV